MNETVIVLGAGAIIDAAQAMLRAREAAEMDEAERQAFVDDLVERAKLAAAAGEQAWRDAGAAEPA